MPCLANRKRAGMKKPPACRRFKRRKPADFQRGTVGETDQAETAAHGKQPACGNGERRKGTGGCRTESQPERCRDRHARHPCGDYRTLFARQYIVREKKNLVPTDKGLAVYKIVKDKKIADVEMTGMWETALSKIEAGSMDADTFRKGIEVYATQITAELLSVQLSVATGETCPCPKCNNGASCSTRKWRSVPTWTARSPYSATSATSSFPTSRLSNW